MGRRTVCWTIIACAVVFVVAALRPTVWGAEAEDSEWRAYGGRKSGDKYSPLDQVNKDTVRNLKIAWRQSATPVEVREGRTNAPIPSSYEHTPLMAGGLLYMSTGYGTVAALDPATGAVKWFDSAFGTSRRDIVGTGGQPSRGSASRSLAYWTDGADARVIAIVGTSLVAL